MKVVLRKDIETLGEIDDVVNVADGHARNFLFPRRLAAIATKQELVAVEKRGTEKAKRVATKRAEAEELAKRLTELEIKILADVGEAGKLFGSVTSQDIVKEIKVLSGLDLDKKKIHLKEPIKMVGNYSVGYKVYKDIIATLKIAVAKQAKDSAEEAEASAEQSE